MAPPRENSFFIDDIDVHDETDLNYLRECIADLTGAGKSLRIAFLNASQWEQAITNYLPPRYRTMAPSMHALIDPEDKQHLLVSPVGVRGVNENSFVITTEMVFQMLRASGKRLSQVWQNGLDDILAKRLLEQNTDFSFSTRTHPREQEWVEKLIEILVMEYGYSQGEWLAALKQRPGSVFTALARTKFAAFAIEQARLDPELSPLWRDQRRPRDRFIKLLTDPRLRSRDPLFVQVGAWAQAYQEGVANEAAKSANETRKLTGKQTGSKKGSSK